MAEYERDFRGLSRFAPEAISREDLKAHKFTMGLRPALKQRVEMLRLKTYAEVVDTTKIIEKGLEEGRQAHQERLE